MTRRKGRRAGRSLPPIFAAALWASLAHAGVVHTLTASLRGEVAFVDGGVKVGGRTVKSDRLVLVHAGGAAGMVRPPNVVRWRGGEAWRCEVVALRGEAMEVRSALLGERTVKLGGLAAVEFLPNLSAAAKAKAKTLYRERGEPVPGALLWISATQIAVDSPLGAIALDRRGVRRYVVRATGQAERGGARLAPGQAEVLLADGSVLRGAVAVGKGQVRLRHASLGELSFTPAAVHAVLFPAPNVAWLTDLPRRVQAASLVGGEAPPATVAHHTAGDAAAGTPRFMRWVRIGVGGQVTYSLPGAGVSAVLRMTPVPAPGVREAAVLRVAAGGKTVYRKVIGGGRAAQQEAASIDLGRTKDVTIAVSFARRVRLPCALVLGDPHVVVR